MGKHEDFSSEEMEFIVEKFLQKLSNSEIVEEIQESTTFTPRPIRSIQKIRKIYDAVDKVYKAKLKDQEQKGGEHPTTVDRIEELSEHFNKLADIARTLAFRQKWLLDNRRWLFTDNGFPRYSGTIDGGIKVKDTGEQAVRFNQEAGSTVDLIPSQLLLLHFNFQFPDYTLENWNKIPKGKEKQIAEKLTLLGYGKAFTICPSCPICKSFAKKIRNVP